MRMRARRRDVMARQRRQAVGQRFHVDAPTGGLNTRDSVDNMPPLDAVELENWYPDIGAVRTRPGYSEHCDSDDLTDTLLSNGGFETAGGGGADIWANWTESAGDGALANEGAIVHSGDDSAKVTAGATANTYVKQAGTTVAEREYKVKFWTRGDGTDAGRYLIYDASNAADIVALVTTGVTAATWTEVTVVFSTPVGCVSTELYLYCSTTDTAITYFDDVNFGHSPGNVETLAEYISGSKRHLIAGENGIIYNASSSSPSLLSDLGEFENNRWQTVNFDGKLGMVNGVDTAQQWDGTDLTDLTITGPTKPIGVNAFKNRTYFWDDNSQSIWYSAANALGGNCTEFALSHTDAFGGNILEMITWTRDGGAGPDDFAVFLMTSGHAIVYQGTYPGATADWAIVGVYDIGEPLSIRGSVKFGGDVLIITEYDYVSLQAALQGVEAQIAESKISGALRIATNTYRGNFGWQSFLYPRGKMAIFNIPVSENATYEQHVLNLNTKAWTKFTGIEADCWSLFASDPYFGSADGKIYEFDDGDLNGAGAISSKMQQAWSPLNFGANKSVIAMREFYKTNIAINISNTFAVDYEDFPTQSFPASVSSDGTDWGSDWGSSWGPAAQVFKWWQSVGVFGQVVSRRKYLTTKQEVIYLGTSWLFEASEAL